MPRARQARSCVIVVENLPVPFDRRVWQEAQALHRAGWIVSVICPTNADFPKAFEVIDDIAIYRHPLPAEGRGALAYLREYSTALFHEFRLLFKVHRERGFSIIQACNPPDLIFLVAGFWKIFFGVRFIFDQHDIGPELYEAKFGRRDFFWKLLCWFERRSFALADVSIATNNSYCEIAITRGRMAAEKVFVVRSGPNLARVREMPPDASWKNGRDYLVAYVGVIGAQEGLDLLLDSIAHVVRGRRRSDVQFVVIGAGPELDAVRALSQAQELDAFVTFTGRVDDPTLFAALSAADVCVNPDRPNAMNDKSTMNKIMEYMALGKPIVQFDLTEGRFSAQDASLYARNTDTADFGDRILELLADPARRAAMGETGRARIRDVLAWPHEAPKLLAAYAAALKDSGDGTNAKEPNTAKSPAATN
jgi:glycosyltransferase involved in cell wall biosynthesis